MLFSSLAKSLSENYSGVLYGIPDDRDIIDATPYKQSAVLPASDCLSIFTPAPLAQLFTLPANILCIGTMDNELYQRIQGSGSNYVIVPEAASSEVVCHVMDLFGNTLKQQKLYSDIMYMLFSDVDLGSVFCELSQETGFQMLAIDVSGKVLAHSKPFEINHIHWQRSLEMGYLDQYLVEFIQASRVKNKMDLSTKPNYLYCNMLKMHIKYVRVVADGTLIGYIFMGGKHDGFPHFSDRLLQAFSKKLHSILVNNRDFRSFRVSMHQNILSDLIDGASEEEIIQRIRCASLNFPANMRAIVMKPSFFRGASFLYSTLLPEVSSLLPSTPKFIRSSSVVALLAVNSSGEIAPELCEKLTELAKTHKLHIGVSNQFVQAASFSNYYHQAIQALDIAKRIPNMYGLFYFSDHAFYILLNSMENKELLRHIKMPLLDEIKEYDNEKNSALYETLKAYAQTGFSKNRTADLMFLHRNTVNYRIQQLENLFSIDFSDPSLLFKLQYSFYIDAYIKHQYADLFPTGK